jgi:ABC-type sulfate transport system permease subunit
MSTVQATRKPTDVEAGRTHRAPTPWGRLGLRTAALSYLVVMLIIPLALIFQDGLRKDQWILVPGDRANRLERS